MVRGRRGLNTVRLTGRFNGRPLGPGTYGIVVIVQRGPDRVRVGWVSVQIVPRRSLRRARGPAPVFSCVGPSQGEGGANVLGLLGTPPSGLRFEPPAPRQPTRSGVLAVPPLHLDGGSGAALSGGLLALIFYATLGIAGSGLLVWALRH